MSKVILLLFLGTAVNQTVTHVSHIAYAEKCLVPKQFTGEFFSIEGEKDLMTFINEANLEESFRPNLKFNGICVERRDDGTSYDVYGRPNHNSKILFYSSSSNCYKCFYFIFRTPKVIQYKKSSCVISDTVPTLEEVCAEITESSNVFTYFSTASYYDAIDCKSTVHGIFPFSYEWKRDEGSCNNSKSQIIAYQEPNSPFVDNQMFTMKFGECPGVSLPVKLAYSRYECYGSWLDEQNNTWSAIVDTQQAQFQYRFYCMLTVPGQQGPNVYKTFIISRQSDCNVLNPNEEQVKLTLAPVPMQMLYEPIQILNDWYHGFIKCQVRGGPIPEVSWSFKGENIVSGDGRYWISIEGLNVRFPKDPEDSGEYICRAKDITTGVVEEKKITVLVHLKPHGTELKQVYTANDGVLMTCSAKGSSPLHYIFYKFSESKYRYEELMPSNRFKIDEIAGTLQFNPLAEDDKGDYKCGATNDEGKSFDYSYAIYLTY